MSASLHRTPVDLAALPFDQPVFDAIVADLQRHAADDAPARVWLDAGGGGAGSTGVAFAAHDLLRPWLGFGATAVTPETVFWYRDWLLGLDPDGIAAHYFPHADRWHSDADGLLVADLGTMVDLALIAPFLEGRTTPLRVVEVGGGYGRLAEAFLNVYEGQVKYVLVDAVPASLLHAETYLRAACPHVRIGAHHRGEPFDLDRFDCYIVPTWHARDLDAGSFDLAVNVQSMQEMDQHHVDGYLAWFDALLADGRGLAYFCNRRDHLFRGRYDFPAHWQCLLKQRTPRSWTRDFPAELYRKGGRPHVAENALRSALYRQSLDAVPAILAEAAARGHAPY